MAGTPTTMFSRAAPPLPSFGKHMCVTSPSPPIPASARRARADILPLPRAAPRSTVRQAPCPPAWIISSRTASTPFSSSRFMTSAPSTRQSPPPPPTATGATTRSTTTSPKAPTPPTPMTATSESRSSSSWCRRSTTEASPLLWTLFTTTPICPTAPASAKPFLATTTE